MEDSRLSQGAPELEGVIDHFFLFRHDLGSSCHASEMVARVAVIALNGHRVGFADDMSFFG